MINKCYLCNETKLNKRRGTVRDNPKLKILECSRCGNVNNEKQLKQPCYRLFGSHQAIVRVDGTLSLCCMDYNNICSVGKIEDSILKVWNSEKMINIRKLHINKEFDKIPVCKNCVDNVVDKSSIHIFSENI